MKLFSARLGFRSDSAEWTTPRELLAELEHELGPFQLDPCSTEENHVAPAYFTAYDDGLSESWAPLRVFMNPPYGRAIARWVEKAANEAELGALVVGLLPARTDTEWWHRYVIGRCSEVRFLRGRLKFGGPHGRAAPAPFPSAVTIWTPRGEIARPGSPEAVGRAAPRSIEATSE